MVQFWEKEDEKKKYLLKYTLVITNHSSHATDYLFDRRQPPSRQIRHHQQQENSEQSYRNEEKTLVNKEVKTIRFDSIRFTNTIPILITISM